MIARVGMALALAVGTISSAHAAVVTLDFEGVVPDPRVFGETYPAVLDYYSGGASEAGTTGPNYGISASSTALAFCIDKSILRCLGSNAAKGGVGPGGSRFTAIFLNGPQANVSATFNVLKGFDTGFAFTYSTTISGSVDIFDGLDGSGNLLGTLALGATPSTCPPSARADFCPFVATGLGFAGIARSVVLSGSTNAIVFDDLTFGSAALIAPAVPEPAAWMMMLAGFAIAGTRLRRRAGITLAA